MFAIEVRLLNGRYAASMFDDRTQPEWPPHPARLYSAAVALWADDGQDPTERAALEWWEAQPPPSITCSPRSAIRIRAQVTHFVPGNDATVVRNLHGLGAQISEAVREERAATAGPAKTQAARLVTRLTTKAASDSATAAAIRPASADAREAQLQLLPERRNKQARFYPAVRPDDDTVVYSWTESTPGGGIAVALDGLLGRIGRLGHSSTLVACRVSPDEPGPATFTPGARGHESQMVRVLAPELLEELIAAHGQHQGSEPRSLPAVFAAYSPADAPSTVTPSPSSAGDWIIFDLNSRGGTRRAYAINRATELTRTLRSALIKHAAEPVPPLLSGHRGPDRNDDDHAMFLALPNAGSPRSDGSITALALALPTTVDPAEYAAVIDAVAAFAQSGGQLHWSGGSAQLAPGRSESAQAPTYGERAVRTASRNYWARSSREWSTVTPVALDRFPRALRRKTAIDTDALDLEVGESIASSCRHLGLPAPTSVRTVPSTALAGIPPVGAAGDRQPRRFPFYRAAGSQQQRYSTHISLRFDEPVCGPLVLGAGRHFGYGLFLPVRSEVTR